jgi:hypothetical protein
MKRLVAILCVVAMLGFYIKVFATPTGNASSETVTVSTDTRTASVNFPYETRNLIISNNDASNAVWVDLKNPSNTSCKNYTTTDGGECYYLAAGDTLELYDFITKGVMIEIDTVFAGNNIASPPVSVLATY